MPLLLILHWLKRVTWPCLISREELKFPEGEKNSSNLRTMSLSHSENKKANSTTVLSKQSHNSETLVILCGWST